MPIPTASDQNEMNYVNEGESAPHFNSRLFFFPSKLCWSGKQIPFIKKLGEKVKKNRVN